ncbi:proton myo-inositol cotransporter [Plakobranchus ocellatus]|uniref:Proton myo-inositol cotransporter n=1 Tax=Plakobranchus ocellatus TaxID=259542 RepID=A0AAV3ZNA2_9GAST|nr:proton myo-inositol cotransporter [Plakobranchus ocellatus]
METSKSDLAMRRDKHPIVVYMMAFCATIGGFLFGYDTGIINGAILLLQKEFDLSPAWVEGIVSSCIGAAAVFSLFSGLIADALGRKVTIMITAVVFTIGALLMGVAPGPELILVGRLTVGAAIGVVSAIVPVYVAECSPADIRGRLITVHQLCITIGIWVSSILAGAFQELDQGWRYMLGLGALPGVLQFVMFFWLPESPRYEMMKGHLDKAKATLQRLRAKDDVTFEMDAIQVTLDEEENSRGWQVWKGIFTTPHVRKAFFVGCMLQFLAQFSGINTVIYYSSSILKSAGFDVRMAIWLSVIPTTVNFLATFIGLWAVETMGRKKVLAASFLAIAVSLLVLAAGFFPSWLSSPYAGLEHERDLSESGVCSTYSNCYTCTQDFACGFCYSLGQDGYPTNGSCILAGEGDLTELYSLEGRCSSLGNGTAAMLGGSDQRYAFDYCPSDFAWLAVLGCMLFVLGFAPGAGPMPWTVNAEIYPLWARSVANSLTTVVNWVSNFTVVQNFLRVTRAITTWGTFLGFAVVCVLAAIFALVAVPETKDKTLEEVELLFMSKRQREITQRRFAKARAGEHVELAVRHKAELNEVGKNGVTNSGFVSVHL